MAQQRGDSAAAADLFVATATVASAAASSATTPATQHLAIQAAGTAFCLLGRLREAAGDAPGAREAYKAAADLPGAAGAAADPYPAVALANLAFQGVYAAAADDAAREGALRACFERYKDVLKRHPHSLAAANGLGMVLAEQGRLEAARDVFAHLREAQPDAAPLAVNLAHTDLATGNAAAALQLYAHAAKRLQLGGGGGAPAVTGGVAEDAVAVEQAAALSFHARAHLEARSFDAALASLARVVAASPADLRARYNLAFVQAESALHVLSMDPAARTAAQVERAVASLRAAVRGFEWLRVTVNALADEGSAGTATGARARARVEAVGVSRERLGVFLAHLQHTLPAAEAHLADARLRATAAAAEAQGRAEKLAARAAARREEAAGANADADRRKAEAAARARAVQALLLGVVPGAAGGSGAGASSLSSAAAEEAEPAALAGGKRKKKSAPRPGKRRRPGLEEDNSGEGAVGEEDTATAVAAVAASSDSSLSSSSSDSSESDSSSSDSDTGDEAAAAAAAEARVREVFGEEGEGAGAPAAAAAASTADIEDLFGEEDA